MADEAVASVLQQIENLCRSMNGELQMINGELQTGGSIESALAQIEAAQTATNTSLESLVAAQAQTNVKLDQLIAMFAANPAAAVALQATFNPPTVRKESVMQFKLFKKSALPKKAMAAHPKATAVTGVGLLDNEDDTFTVTGIDAQGFPTDISALVTLTDSSDAPTVFTVDPPVGMGSTVHGLTPGSGNLLIAATYIPVAAPGTTPPPLNLSVPTTISHKAGPATGLSATFGTPVARP